MANGFKALRHVGGGVQRLSEYPIADAYASNLFNGDMVTLNAGSVELSAAADVVTGSFLGCMYVGPKGEQVFSPNWPAALANTSERYALINEDKGVSYKVYALAAAGLAVGDSVDVATASGGSTLTGASGMTAVARASTSNIVVRKILDEDVDVNGTLFDVVEVRLLETAIA